MYDKETTPRQKEVRIAAYNGKMDGETLDYIYVNIYEWMDYTDILTACTEEVILWCSDNGYEYEEEVFWEETDNTIKNWKR